ncbi:MAG: MBL fold metallo-hydrolase [Thermodesulfobacteriota bacterium]|nr:MBL fold metallo-hydrolase [Thermodesulfobacteriota bacterium]
MSGVILDHRIPCLGLSLTENFHVNIIKEGLRCLGLPVGPWLSRFKAAIYQKRDFESDFWVTWEEGGGVKKRERFLLGELVKKIAVISPGQKIAYITDVTASTKNCVKIIELAKAADILFIEASFLDSERETARSKYHLTAREAGELARKAGAKYFQLFHFSPRYADRGTDLVTEAREAYKKHYRQP